MKISLYVLTFFLLAGNFVVSGQGRSLQSFPLSSVSLLEGPFYDAQQADRNYILELDPDRLLAPYLIDAGFEPRAKRYGNWENTGLDGHIGGHYLSALSMMYAATGDDELIRRLDYMIDWLEKCQKKNGNGYVGGVPGGKAMWQEVAQGKIDAGNFSLNGKWVPLYNIHKLFAGLKDAYLIAGNQKAMDILVNLSDWCLDMTKDLSDEQIQQMLQSEHGGMNEVLADVADITGNDKYLVLARRFSHRAILDPLLNGRDELTGLHANTQIPKVVGYQRIAELANDTAWSEAAGFFWHNIVDRRSVSIGGNSVREHFHPVDDFSSMVESPQGPETCNTYNMLRLTKMLFEAGRDAGYMDYYERSLYNHILTSQHPVKGGFVYFTPMRPRHYRVYSQPQQCFWCCVGAGLENHGKYGALIYSHDGSDIYVNLFIPSVLEWKEKGITLRQQTTFPFEQSTRIVMDMEHPAGFTMHVRYPGWVEAGGLAVSVNGNEIPVQGKPGSYVQVERMWEPGDELTVSLPMHTSVEYLPDDSPWASVLYGPVVLAAATGATDLDGLYADGSRMGHVAAGELYPIDESPVILTGEKDFSGSVKKIEDKHLSFTLDEIVYPDEYKGLELVPFFTVHDTRYIVYWQVSTREELETKKKAVREREKKLLALEARTIDQVATGEQQPETEHNFKGERTETGNNDGHSWRDARGWFSYELSDEKKEAKKLQVTYFGRDKGRRFDILLNGHLIAEVALDGSAGSRFFEVEYDIPPVVTGNMKEGIITVKFIAKEGYVAGGIYHVRLLR